jgi:ribokinase
MTSFVGENPLIAQKEVLKKNADVQICFDPGSLYAKKGLKSINQIIQRSYALFPNEREIKMLTGMNYKEGAKKLMDLGVEIIGVKLGKRGSYVTNGTESYIIKSNPVRVVDTTGAGDAYCAGFIYGLVKGKDLFDCGKLGNFVASYCVSAMGARTGLPYATDLKEN